MFTKLEINNFQSHKHSILEFHPGMNVIIGKTDSGKSAIIRSLKLITKNKPSGEAFISHWADFSHITLYTENNIIERKKGKENSYILNNQNYTGFGQLVPEEVQKVLNIDESNTQFQFDNVFLLSKSSGEVATYFNKIANLNLIDTSISNIKKQINTRSKTIDLLKEIIKTNQEKIKQYKYLEKYESILETVQEDKKQIDSVYQKISNLQKIVQQEKDIQNDLFEYKQIISTRNLVDKTIKLYQLYQTKKDRLEQLKNTLERVNTIQTNIEEYKIITSLKPIVSTSIDLYKSIQTKSKQIKDFNKIIDHFTSIKEQIQNTQEKYKKLNTEFNTQFPDICPLCGHPKEKK